MPFCPTCRQEFEAFAKECPDCEVALTAELPAEPVVQDRPTADLRADDLESAQAMLDLIQSAGIPVVPGPDPAPGERYILRVPSDFERSTGSLIAASPQFEQTSGAPASYRFVAPETVEAEDEPPDLSVLRDSVRQLAARGSEVIAPLLEIVRRGEGDARKKAVLAISAMGPVGRQALTLQATALAREGRDQALYAVVGELRTHPMSRDDLAELEGIAVGKEADPEIRIAALHALGRFRLPELADSIVELLSDPNPGLREAADEALCNLLDDDVGFDSNSPAGEQAAAITRWRERLGAR